MGTIIGILSRLFSGAGIIIVILIGIVLDILEPMWTVLKYLLYGFVGVFALNFSFMLIMAIYDWLAYLALRLFSHFAGRPKPKRKDTMRDWQRKRRREKFKRQANNIEKLAE